MNKILLICQKNVVADIDQADLEYNITFCWPLKENPQNVIDDVAIQKSCDVRAWDMYCDYDKISQSKSLLYRVNLINTNYESSEIIIFPRQNKIIKWMTNIEIE